MIVHKGNKWVVMDSSGKKVLGTHPSKEKAAKQLSAIEISKKEIKENSERINIVMDQKAKQLLENLLQRIDILEQELQKYRSQKLEYMPDQRIDEALDRVGGNVNNVSPSIRCLANKIQKSTLIDSVINKLNEGNEMNKKSFKDQGTKIQLSEQIVFGGFPRILNEQSKVPPEVMIDLVQTNDPELYKDFIPNHSPLPEHIHKAVLAKVKDEVLSGGDIDVSGSSITGHLKDVMDAIKILDQSGHGKHPIALHLDTLRDQIEGAIGRHEERQDRRGMRLTGRSSES